MKSRIWFSALLTSASMTCASAIGQPSASDLLLPSIRETTVRVEKNQRMLEITVPGDPDRNGDSAIQALLSHFFRGAGEAEMNVAVQPRVRWVLRSQAVPKRAWVAVYGLPVSEAFPAPSAGSALVQTWKYGLVAETSYSGPYAGAQSAIDSLKAYISSHGFTLFGGMEEVYVRGRGTLDQGNPEAYLTLIRYRVREVRDVPLPTRPLSANP